MGLELRWEAEACRVDHGSTPKPFLVLFVSFFSSQNVYGGSSLLILIVVC